MQPFQSTESIKKAAQTRLRTLALTRKLTPAGVMLPIYRGPNYLLVEFMIVFHKLEFGVMAK